MVENIMETSIDVVIPDFRGYGDIIVPKGTRLTNKTACGIDNNYHFVAEYGWIDKNYPTVNRLLKHDVIHYGINIPIEFVSFL